MIPRASRRDQYSDHRGLYASITLNTLSKKDQMNNYDNFTFKLTIINGSH